MVAAGLELKSEVVPKVGVGDWPNFGVVSLAPKLLVLESRWAPRKGMVLLAEKGDGVVVLAPKARVGLLLPEGLELNAPGAMLGLEKGLLPWPNMMARLCSIPSIRGLESLSAACWFGSGHVVLVEHVVIAVFTGRVWLQLAR